MLLGHLYGWVIVISLFYITGMMVSKSGGNYPNYPKIYLSNDGSKYPNISQYLFLND